MVSRELVREFVVQRFRQPLSSASAGREYKGVERYDDFAMTEVAAWYEYFGGVPHRTIHGRSELDQIEQAPSRRLRVGLRQGLLSAITNPTRSSAEFPRLSSMPLNIRLRPVVDADQELLYRCYASTRTEELSVVPWSDEDKEQFLQMQFRAQSDHYAKHYAKAEFQVIMANEAPAGRLIVDRWEREIRIVDIAILPEFRARGIGTSLLGDLIDDARPSGKSLGCNRHSGFTPLPRFRGRGGVRGPSENQPPHPNPLPRRRGRGDQKSATLRNAGYTQVINDPCRTEQSRHAAVSAAWIPQDWRSRNLSPDGTPG